MADLAENFERAKNQVRSVSQTEQWEKCGHRFFLQRIQRVTPRPAAWSHHGTAFHSAAEALELSGRTLGEEEAVEVFSEQYSALTNKALQKEPNVSNWLSAGRGPAEDIEKRFVIGQQQTREYVQWSAEHQPVIWKSPEGKPGVELNFTVEFGGVKVRGFIDQLIVKENEAVRPRDLKTGSTKSHFQLQTYGLAVRKLWDVEVEDADWYLAKEGRLSRPVKLDGVSEDELADRYGRMDQGVKDGLFYPTPSFSCRFCDVAWACSYRQ